MKKTIALAITIVIAQIGAASAQTDLPRSFGEAAVKAKDVMNGICPIVLNQTAPMGTSPQVIAAFAYQPDATDNASLPGVRRRAVIEAATKAGMSIGTADEGNLGHPLLRPRPDEQLLWACAYRDGVTHRQTGSAE